MYPSPRDRWGATPLSDAKDPEVYAFLVEQGVEKGEAHTVYN